MGVYINREPWKAITPRVEAATQRVVAAMGYVGSEAHKLLPLAKGDLLVCDLSESAVKSGATNPEAILDFLKAKVIVRSRQGLHAKVVVLGRRAYVGSNNASDHSAKKLIEATIETTDSSEVKKLRKFVEQLDGEEITKRRIQELMLLRPKRPRTPGGDIIVAELPKALPEIKILGCSFVTRTASEDKAAALGKSDAKSLSRKYGTGMHLESTPWSSGSARLRVRLFGAPAGEGGSRRCVRLLRASHAARRFGQIHTRMSLAKILAADHFKATLNQNEPFNSWPPSIRPSLRSLPVLSFSLSLSLS